ncbi:uncharacterized protein LOC135834134 [Planococcus citri]|uniref:uncharacterized protein LOC135834134 n=1 Tax=Planococcus citri TaxID=170843 RepID=UPI0031F9011B
MANTLIVLLYVITNVWMGTEVNSISVVNTRNLVSLAKNYIMASENKTWADIQIKKAQNKCEEYTQYACQYQKSCNGKHLEKDEMLNGEYVSEGMLPHMAFLHIRIVSNDTMKKKPVVLNLQCTGTLISEKFVMTAGRCTTYKNSRTKIKVKLGSSDITDDATGEWYDVEHIYEHPYYVYRYEDLLHDIALIQLSETVRFNANMRPICLNTNYRIGEHKSLTTAAWGYTEDGNTDRLKMANLPMHESACDEWLGNNTMYYKIVKLYTICAGEKRNGTCDGDSGGPLQIMMKTTCPNMYEQIGITSLGNGYQYWLDYDYRKGIFTKVAHYVPWIASIVWPDSNNDQSEEVVLIGLQIYATSSTKCSVSNTMANTMIVLSHIIINMWIVIQVHSPLVTSLRSMRDNYIMACGNKTWADQQIKKAQNKCKEYTQYACQYQTSRSEKDRILNGEYVSEGMLPHMAYVSIRRKKITGKAHLDHYHCSGTLISEKFVITAAHCMTRVNYDGEIMIKLGSLDRTDDGTGQWYGVEFIYKHPYFNRAEGLLHDIALVELSKTVHFTAHVRPICLNTNYKIEMYNNVTITAAGYGFTEHGQNNYLKMVTLPLKESTCLRIFKLYRNVAKLYTICAGEAKKDTCKGDSGGPLQILINDTCPNMYEQIGVTSLGQGDCSLSSTFNVGTYGKVAPYVPWIASIVWPELEES